MNKQPRYLIAATANTVNKFLNDHSQEVIKEVKPEISRQLTELVTRVMNDAFSELPADKAE